MISKGVIFEFEGFLFQHFFNKKFLDAGIQDVSTSISIVNDKTEMSDEDDDDGDESDKHI